MVNRYFADTQRSRLCGWETRSNTKNSFHSFTRCSSPYSNEISLLNRRRVRFSVSTKLIFPSSVWLISGDQAGIDRTWYEARSNSQIIIASIGVCRRQTAPPCSASIFMQIRGKFATVEGTGTWLRALLIAEIVWKFRETLGNRLRTSTAFC